VKNKILLISLAAVLALSLGIVGCTGEGPVEVEPLNLAFTDHNPPFIATAKALDAYAEYIAARSCGAINISVAHAGEGLGEGEVWGEMQLADPSYDAGNIVPEIGYNLGYIQVMTLPFMGWGSQHVANDVYFNVTEQYPEILAEFPTTVKYVGNYMMPPVQLSFKPNCLNITTPTELANYLSGKNPLTVMEDTLGDVLELIPGVTTSTEEFGDVVGYFCSSALYHAFAQHLEFCYAFGILNCCESWTIFPGGIVMIPMGVLWNAASYDDCVDKLMEACDLTEGEAEAIMEGARAEYIETCYIYTNDPDTIGWQLHLANPANGCGLELTGPQTAVWEAAVSDYFDDWKDACANNVTAQNIYDSAKAAITYHMANPAGY
jgi:hypothetical protein